MTFEQWRDEFRAFQDGFVAWKRKHHADEPVTFGLVRQHRTENYPVPSGLHDEFVEEIWHRICTR